MAIQMRRGQEVNFDADKMLPGEWAVSLDTRYVRMCFAPGVCVRMATYDAFEVDMTKVEAILAECQTIEEVVTRINTEVSANAKAVAEYTSQAKKYRDEAEEFRNQAEEIVGFGKATKDDLGIIRGGDNYIDENGTLVLTRTTTERELIESQNGGIRIISMDGESRQKQYSGKNLEYNSATYEGWNVWSWDGTLTNETYNGGKVIKYTVEWQFRYPPSSLFKAGTYTVSFDAKSKNNGNALVYSQSLGVSKEIAITSNTFKRYSYTFTVSEEKSGWISVLIPSGSTVGELYVANIQVEKGSTMTEYEPYVGGIASPNPDYPQDIDSVEISEIWTHGKNLQYNSATYEGWLKQNGGGTILDETYNGGKIAKYTTNWNHRYPPNRLFKAGTYTISFDAKVKTDGSVHIYSSGLGSGVSKNLWITASNTFSRYSHTFTLTEDKTGYITPMIPTGSTVEELYVANIQVEEGSETPYEPYTETKATLSAPIVLRSIGDAKDVLCKMNGVYGVLRNIWGVFLTDLSWGLRPDITSSTTTIDMYQTNSLENTVVVGVGLCSHTSRITSSLWSVTHETFSINDKYLRFTLDRTRLTNSTASASNFINWLRENNVEAILRLATPTFEPLPTADQIALHQLETFGGVTYLFTDSTIEPIIEVEYGTSKVGGYAIKGLNNGEISLLELEQLKTLTNELATQLVAGSEA